MRHQRGIISVLVVVLEMLFIPFANAEGGYTEDLNVRSAETEHSATSLHTVIVLDRPVSMEIAAEWLSAADLPVIAIEHVGRTRGGILAPRPLSPREAISRYADLLATAKIRDVEVFAFRLAGQADGTLLPNVARWALVPADATIAVAPASTGGAIDVIRDAKSADAEGGSDASSNSGSLWVPTSGTLSGTEIGSPRPSADYANTHVA